MKNKRTKKTETIKGRWQKRMKGRKKVDSNKERKKERIKERRWQKRIKERKKEDDR